MATPETLRLLDEGFRSSSLFESSNAENENHPALSIEKKIELLERLAGQVSNRRSRRLINDRLLMELVPRLSAGEIRGLFAPPPWGDEVPPSPFQMACTADWDRFRSIDMDKQEILIGSLNRGTTKGQTQLEGEKMAALKAWRRIDSRTRDFLRRCSLTELIAFYEDSIRKFVDSENELLVMKVDDAFHRLLLHGVCEFYNLVSTTECETQGSKSVKMTKIKKKASGVELPNITLNNFLKVCKEGSS